MRKREYANVQRLLDLNKFLIGVCLRVCLMLCRLYELVADRNFYFKWTMNVRDDIFGKIFKIGHTTGKKKVPLPGVFGASFDCLSNGIGGEGGKNHLRGEHPHLKKGDKTVFLQFGGRGCSNETSENAFRCVSTRPFEWAMRGWATALLRGEKGKNQKIWFLKFQLWPARISD